MTDSTFWIVAVVALGLPSAIVAFMIRLLERKIDSNEKAREEKEALRIEHEVMMIDLSMTSLALAEATAEAVQRIPDANCNGDMQNALDKAKETQERYRKFERKQTVKSIS